jgi:hypothetical protein
MPPATGTAVYTRRPEAVGVAAAVIEALPFLTGPLWAPPQPYRRLLARDEGRDRCRTVFSYSASALPAHATSAHGPSGATYLVAGAKLNISKLVP